MRRFHETARPVRRLSASDSPGGKARLCAVRTLLTFLAAFAFLLASANAQEERFFRIGTAGATGTYFQIGGIIASAISGPAGLPNCNHGGSCGVPGLIAIAQTTEGSRDNINLMAKGELDSALVQADIASAALHGTGSFQGSPVPELMAIGALFPESIHIAVRRDSNIQKIGQLRGLRVAVGEKQSGTLTDSRMVLAAAGIGMREVKADYAPLGDAVAKLQDKSLDAVFIVGGDPVPALAEMASSAPLRFLPIGPELFDKLKRQNPLFDRAIIPGDFYAGVAEDTPTIGTAAIWAVSSKVPEQLVYEITRALWSDATQLLIASRHPMGSRILKANALNGFDLALHPGAERYYREVGMLATNKP